MSAGAAAVQRLDAAFFERSVHEVARELIGCRLFYEGCGGTIVETESYERDDPACHAFVGLTPRTETLFGPPGRAYVYLSYGIHSLLNFVAEPEGEAAAVLIRALEPTAGLEEMRARRGAPRRHRPLLGAGQADRGARHRPRRQRRRPLPRPVPDPAARGRRPAPGPHRPPDRDHQGRRAPLALLRRGAFVSARPVRLAARGRAG